jgi:hypothetical protein
MKVNIYFVGDTSIKLGPVEREDVRRLLIWYRRQRQNEVFELTTDEGSYYFAISQVALIVIPK